MFFNRAHGIAGTIHRLKFLLPPDVCLVRLVWVHGHRVVHLNKVTDALAKAPLRSPVTTLHPTCAYIAAARFHNNMLLRENMQPQCLLPLPTINILCAPGAVKSDDPASSRFLSRDYVVAYLKLLPPWICMVCRFPLCSRSNRSFFCCLAAA